MERANMKSLLKKLTRNDKGATAIEYGLIAALIAVMLIGALGTLGNNMGRQFGNIANKVSTPGR
jgi:pilus assembly protein Flp/PilA